MDTFTRKMLFLVAALVAASASWCSTAAAQELGLKCGATIESNLSSSTANKAITSTNFVVLHDTNFAINLGTIADCAVVLFTAQTACKGASSDDTCYIRALDNGAQMRPAATNGAIFDSESQTPSAHSLAWVSRGPLSGTHHFTIEVRAGKASTTFAIDNWTVHVQLLAPPR